MVRFLVAYCRVISNIFAPRLVVSRSATLEGISGMDTRPDVPRNSIPGGLMRKQMPCYWPKSARNSVPRYFAALGVFTKCNFGAYFRHGHSPKCTPELRSGEINEETNAVLLAQKCSEQRSEVLNLTAMVKHQPRQ